MKLFVTGGTGLVGSNVIKVAREKYDAEIIASMFKRVPKATTNYTIERMDVGDRKAVMSVLRNHRPDVVIHSAASVDHDRLEYEHGMGWHLMVEGTRAMAEVCGEIGAKLIFVSSDWVFDGKNPPFKEDTPACPVNYYGLLKVVGETIVNSIGIDYAIARIAAVYGRNWSFPDWKPKERVTGFGTLPNWMLEALRRGEVVVEWTDHVNIEANPTLASDCADAMMAICVKNLQGTFHCCGRDCCSRVALGRHVARTFGLDESRVRGATQAEMDLSHMEGRSPLPLRSCLDVSETERRLGRRNLGIEEGFEKWKRQMAEPV
jgi:dTDP-4-dehydrorhamnose reductase